jgi:hypothetical protein
VVRRPCKDAALLTEEGNGRKTRAACRLRWESGSTPPRLFEERRVKILYDDQRHLVTVPYSKENLHTAALQLGIKRCWFHKDHYDIPKRMMARMSETVAEKVSPREILRIVRGK